MHQPSLHPHLVPNCVVKSKGRGLFGFTSLFLVALLVSSSAQAKSIGAVTNTPNERQHDGLRVKMTVVKDGYSFEVHPVTAKVNVAFRCLDFACSFQERLAHGEESPLFFKGKSPVLHLHLDNGNNAHFTFRKESTSAWRIASIADAGGHPSPAKRKDKYDQRITVLEEQEALLSSLFLMQQYHGISIGKPLDVYDNETRKRLSRFVQLGGILLVPEHRVDGILAAHSTRSTTKETILRGGTLVAPGSSVVVRTPSNLQIGGRQVGAGALLSYKTGNFDDVEAAAAFVTWHLSLKRSNDDLTSFAHDIAASRSLPFPSLGLLFIFGLGWLLLASALLWQGRKQPWQKILTRVAIASAAFTTLIIGARFLMNSAQSEVIVHRVLHDGTEHSTTKATSIVLSRSTGKGVSQGHALHHIGTDLRRVQVEATKTGWDITGARLQRIISTSRSVGSGAQVYQEKHFSPVENIHFQTIIKV
ncbi:MAG: hypothetical protein GY822_26600, partial [Deltaproteobacteria bacterium]|nr:hypothetical protein [Deltaproteobacteria bacterium]